MARLISYPILSTVASEDLLPITDVSDTGRPLKNVTLTTLREFVNDGATLQRVISTGNTYQASTSGYLWTWNEATLIVDGSNVPEGYEGILSGKYIRLRSTAFPNYTTLANGSLVIPLPGAVNTRFMLSANPLIEAGEEVEILSPAASGTLALTTDIVDSPWVPVTGGINYPTNKVGINTALPQEVLDVTGNALFSGNVTAQRLFGNLEGTISTSTVGTTQPSNDNSTKIATTAFVTNAVGAIPSGLTFQGEWDATLNIPDLSSLTPSNGDFWIVSVAGTTNLGGITDWEVGDWAIAVVSGGVTTWQKIDNSSVLTGSGTGQKIAKWDGSGISLTLTESLISEAGGNVSVAGNLESTGFIKTGGAAAEFLMADGSVTTGSFTGNIPTEQITFGNATGDGITSSANLEFDDTFKVLTVRGTLVGQTIVKDDNVLVAKDASTRVGMGITTIPRVQLSQGNVNTYLQLIGVPTQENTIALPDKSGTVALLDDVVGTVTGTGNSGYIPLWASDTALTDSGIFQNTANGWVGIGTDTPFAQLETTEDILIADQVYIGTGDGPSQQNLRFGSGTLVSNLTGVYNIAIGQSVLGLATGNQNTAIGALAMMSTSTGEKNTAVGAGALYDNLTGSSNVAVGPQSLYSNVLGSRNVAMGYEAMYSNNSNDNVAIGYQAMRSSTNNMNNNVAIGNEAGRSGNAAFYNNTLIGQQAGLNATTGNGAVVIGRQAARIAADGTGNVTGLTRSTIIGAFAYPLETTSQDEIVIGYNANGLGDNTTVIGTTVTTKTRLYGDIDAATGDVEVADNTKGLILSSPDGTRYRVTVANGGTLTVTAV